MLVDAAGPEEVEAEDVLPEVDGRFSAASVRDGFWADLGCIMAKCLLDNCWRTVRVAQRVIPMMVR